MAAERGDAVATRLLQSALHAATAGETAGAKAWFERMEPRYADRIAAVRADNKYRRFMREARATPGFGGGKCIYGLNTNSGAGTALNPSLRQAGVSGGSKVPPLRGCTMAMEDAAVNTMERGYSTYFRNWKGKVVVRPVEQVP